MSKIPPRTIPSDDLVIVVDGVEYRPHEGETVTVRGQASWKLLEGTTAMFGLYQRLGSLSADEQARAQTAVDEVFEELSRLIVDWTWTDDEGDVLPQSTSDVLRRLSLDEFQYLLGLVTPQGPSKNSSEPSTST